MQPNSLNDQQTGNNATPGVMDVQRPVVSGQPTMVRPVQGQTPSGLSRPATREFTRPRPDITTEARAFTQSSQPSVQPFNFNDNMHQEDTIQQSNAVPKNKKSKKLFGLIIVILVIAILGAGGAAYYYLVLNKATPIPVAEQATDSTPVQVEEKIEATAESVDTTIKNIDKELDGMKDTEDFTPNDLSDDSLGL